MPFAACPQCFGGLLALLPLVVVAHAAAVTVSLTPTKDNTLYEEPDGGLSNGGGSHFFAGTSIANLIRRGLLAFDVAGRIPAGSTIVSANLRLHLSRTISAAEEVSLHRVAADWGEGVSVGFGEEGGGAPSQPGDATWKHTSYDTNTWSAPGGDFDPAPSASALVIGIGFYTWKSTAELVSDVQFWLDQPQRSFGWLVRGNESLEGTAKRFDSRDNPDPAFRPVLTIDYIPEPATAGLVSAAMLLTVRRPGSVSHAAKGDVS